jgi:hypothetical protein
MKKKLVVAATAGALAMAAGQAFALENIFNGSFALRATHSNYATGTAGYLLSPSATVAPGAIDSARNNNFIEQRTRLFYTAKANDNLKFVTGFEIDSTWGKSSYMQGRANDGGAVGADTTNIETKQAYLDFNCPITGANFKGGIMPFMDAYKGVFINADAAGVLLSKGFGPATAGFGWFRLDDRDTFYGVTTATADLGTGAVTSTTSTSNALGRQTRDLLVLDGKFNVNKDVKVGGSYYYLANYGAADRTNARADQRVHTLGVNAAATFGPATVDGFLLYQFGRQSTGTTATVYGQSQHVEALVGNVAAKVKAGPGSAKVAALYVSGGTSDNGRKSAGFVNVNNQTSASFAENTGGAAGSTMLLFRNPSTTSADQSLVYDTSFNGNGVVGLSAGYDANITEKAFASANVGMAWSATNRNANVSGAAYNPNRAYSKYLGTELNATIGYKLFDNLTASAEAAYVLLGGFYEGKGRAEAGNPAKGSDPANPYVGRILMTYAF